MKKFIVLFLGMLLIYSCQKDYFNVNEVSASDSFSFLLKNKNSKVSYNYGDKFPVYHSSTGKKGDIVINNPRRSLSLSVLDNSRSNDIIFSFSEFDWTMTMSNIKKLDDYTISYDIAYSDEPGLQNYVLESENEISVDAFKASLLEVNTLLGDLEDLTVISEARCGGLCTAGIMAVVSISVGVVNHCTNVINQGIANCSGDNQCFTTGLCSVNCYACDPNQ